MEQNHVDSNQQSSEQKDEEKRPDNDSRTRRQFSSYTTPVQPPKPAGARQRWAEFRPSKTMFFWSLAAAVALTMFVVFTWGGWMTSASAQKLAATSANNAVIERLAPICVAQFNLDPDKDQKLKTLQEEASTSARTKYVTDQAWATMSGDEQPDRKVADACAKLLMQIGQ